MQSCVLAGLAHREAGCPLRGVSVAARLPLPARWRGDYDLALVRRGIVVRQRVDGAGRVTSIDIAGPGSALPIGARDDDGAGGYAVDEVMLCLCSSDTFGEAVGGGSTDARDVVKAQAMILRRVERIAEARSRPSAISRVAALLLAISDTLAPLRRLDAIPSAIQQRDLALLLALRHESICRALAGLEKKGLVQQSGDGLRIVDRPGLEAL